MCSVQMEQKIPVMIDCYRYCSYIIDYIDNVGSRLKNLMKRRNK